MNTFLKTFLIQTFSLKYALDRNGCEQILAEKLNNNVYLYLIFFSFVKTNYYTVYCQSHYYLDLLLVFLMFK